jgi:hypothetical protein
MDLCVIAVIIILIYLLLDKAEGFSLSTKPFEEDNTLLLRNPFDDVDYQTPNFYVINSV